MLKPNEGRILVKLARQKEAKQGEIALPHGNATVGDSTVRVCEVVDRGDSNFKPKQLVYAQEYSMMAVADYARYLKGELTTSQLFKDENMTYSVSKYDVVAYDAVSQELNCSHCKKKYVVEDIAVGPFYCPKCGL